MSELQDDEIFKNEDVTEDQIQLVYIRDYSQKLTNVFSELMKKLKDDSKIDGHDAFNVATSVIHTFYANMLSSLMYHFIPAQKYAEFMEDKVELVMSGVKRTLKVRLEKADQKKDE
jgi:hypothetical protein